MISLFSRLLSESIENNPAAGARMCCTMRAARALYQSDQNNGKRYPTAVDEPHSRSEEVEKIEIGKRQPSRKEAR